VVCTIRMSGCPFRKSHPAYICIVRHNHRINVMSPLHPPPKAGVGAVQINICLRAKSGQSDVRIAHATGPNHIASRRINKKRSENATVSHPGGRSRQGAGPTQSQCALSIDVNWSIRGSRSREAISGASLVLCKGT